MHAAQDPFCIALLRLQSGTHCHAILLLTFASLASLDQVHGIFLSRRFVRDSGLLRDLFATCGLPTNGQENVLEDFLDASMLELVVT